MIVRGRRLPPVGIRGHHDEVIEEDPPGVQTHAEAVYPWLLEGVLVEETQELQDWEERVELHTLQVRRHEPVEEVAALCQKPEEEDNQKNCKGQTS